MWFIIILAIIAFLLMEHPVAFWLVFVPLIILFIISAGGFLRGKKGAIGNLVISMIILFLIILALLIVCI